MVVRYPVEIRDKDNCSIDVKVDSGSVNTGTLSKADKGFRIDKSGGQMYIMYQVESEL